MHQDPELILKGYLDSSKLPHALLFIGSNSHEMLKACKSFAKEAFLQRDGKKAHLSKIDSLNHPDFHLFLPESKTGQYTIEQIKEITKKSNLFPNESALQFFILKNADRMGDPAANAFLKSLEEPSKHSIFILLAENLDLIIPTILSRVQKVFFEEEKVNNHWPFQEVLSTFLEKKVSFTYHEICSLCEEVQKEFDKSSLLSKKENEKIFYSDKESKALLLQIEKWYQKKKLDKDQTLMPSKAFYQKLDQAILGLERSMKISSCLEYMLLNFVS